MTDFETRELIHDLHHALDRFLGDECECDVPGAIGPCAYCEGWPIAERARTYLEARSWGGNHMAGLPF